MILGFHIIFSAYGFWLPNDPRGSWSEFVGAWELFRAGGKATKTTERRSLAYDPHDRDLRLATRQKLQRPAVKFDASQVAFIAAGFQKYADANGLILWSCAIMPDHVHMVTGRLRLNVKQLVIRLKGAATNQLVKSELHPFQLLKPLDGPPPKCFGQGEWTVYLDSEEDVRRAVKYVEMNPVKDGLPPQRWDFVKEHPFI